MVLLNHFHLKSSICKQFALLFILNDCKKKSIAKILPNLGMLIKLLCVYGVSVIDLVTYFYCSFSSNRYFELICFLIARF